MAVELVQRLSSEDTGVFVEGLCMDLDSAASAHVRDFCIANDLHIPRPMLLFLIRLYTRLSLLGVEPLDADEHAVSIKGWEHASRGSRVHQGVH